MERHNVKPSKKGKGFEQPLRSPHEHWHVDVSYINVAGTYFFLCSLLDGCSRLIVHWEIREQMTEADVETIIQQAAQAVPRRPSADHLGQWTAVHCQGLQGVHPHLRHDSREDIAILSAEQWQDRALAPLRSRPSASAPGTPLSLEDAQRLVAGYVRHYNEVRLHSAIGYITPADKLAGPVMS